MLGITSLNFGVLGPVAAVPRCSWLLLQLLQKLFIGSVLFKQVPEYSIHPLVNVLIRNCSSLCVENKHEGAHLNSDGSS